MTHLGFESCKSDPDIWVTLEQKDDGYNYWEYVLLYVDDILAISLDPKVIVIKIPHMIILNNDKIEVPYIYLGEQLELEPLSDIQFWTIINVDYINDAIYNVEEEIKTKGGS